MDTLPSEPETLIDHETVHPLVLDAWVELDKAGQVEVSNLEVQTMQCTATELLNRFMPSLAVFDAGNPATGREPRYIISADQVFQLISDTQMITYYTTKRVPAAWEAKYGQPPID